MCVCGGGGVQEETAGARVRGVGVENDEGQVQVEQGNEKTDGDRDKYR